MSDLLTHLAIAVLLAVSIGVPLSVLVPGILFQGAAARSIGQNSRS